MNELRQDALHWFGHQRRDEIRRDMHLLLCAAIAAVSIGIACVMVKLLV
jgi:hypothetical protein